MRCKSLKSSMAAAVLITSLASNLSAQDTQSSDMPGIPPECTEELKAFSASHNGAKVISWCYNKGASTEKPRNASNSSLVQCSVDTCHLLKLEQ